MEPISKFALGKESECKKGSDQRSLSVRNRLIVNKHD